MDSSLATTSGLLVWNSFPMEKKMWFVICFCFSGAPCKNPMKSYNYISTWYRASCRSCGDRQINTLSACDFSIGFGLLLLVVDFSKSYSSGWYRASLFNFMVLFTMYLDVCVDTQNEGADSMYTIVTERYNPTSWLSSSYSLGIRNSTELMTAG